MVGSQTSESEWVGGLVQVPAYATGDGAAYRPEALFYLDSTGAVCAAQVGKPGELLSLAAEILQETIAKSQLEGTLAPTHVRVASAPLAAVLREAMPQLEVVCAETPEVDALLDQMREQFAKDAVLEQTYLAEDADVAGMSALFEAAAALYRAEPWQSALADHAYVFVTIQALDLNGAVLALTGQRGHSPGLVLLASLAHYSLYCAALPQLARGDRPVLPRQLALNFERGAELSPSQRKEIVTHHWEVAGPDAYPWLVVLDEDLIARSPTPREISIAEALARALCLLVDDYDAELDAAARGETAFSCELKVETRFGDLVVVLEAPQAVMNSPEPVNAPVNAADSVTAQVAASPLGQDDLTQGKLAANTGMASPLYPPR
jgi:hypothetical protein